MRNNTMDRFHALSAFAAVADARGFAPAAKKLGLSPSAITRLVAGLEAHLAVRLLHRTTRSVSLTDAGARFLERARRILSELEEAEASAIGEQATPSGKLVVSAPVVFGRLHIGPLLHEYVARYPKVVAELQVSDRYVNLVEEGVDVAVRIGPLQDSSLVVRRVGEVRRVVVASPGYLAKHKKISSPDDLKAHKVISLRALTPSNDWRFGDRRIELSPRYFTNSADDAVWHALHSGGVTMALSYQVDEHVRAGRLKVLLSKYEPPPSPIQLVYPTSRLLSSKVRALIDLVIERCQWRFLLT
jgi:DNA-binding transcriptional LysR family regulator